MLCLVIQWGWMICYSSRREISCTCLAKHGHFEKTSDFRLRLWSSGQSSWLQIQRSGFDSLRYQISWEVVGLERSPRSLVNTTEELLGRKSSGPGLEIQEYGRRDPSRWPLGTVYPKKLALTSLTSGGCSVGIVRSRTQAREFFLNL
jgi:hypothetical protein